MRLAQFADDVAPPGPEDGDAVTPAASEPPLASEDPTDITPEPTQSASEGPSESPAPTSATPTEASSPPPTGSEPAPEPTDGSGSEAGQLPPWLGLVALAALVAAGGALAWRLAARSRRRGWDERLDVEREQGQWVVTELIPALTNPATPPQHVAQHWADAQPTLEQMADGLDALVVEAPDDSRASTARGIAAAVTQVRSSAAAHVALASSAEPDLRAVDATASALLTARAQLGTALGLSS